MARFGVTRDQLLEGRTPDGMKQLFELQARRAEDYYVKAFAKLPEEDRYVQRSGIIMATIYRRILQRIQEKDYPVLNYRVSLPAWQKLWLAWQSFRSEKKRARHLAQQQRSRNSP
jgi:phytoene synthase